MRFHLNWAAYAAGLLCLESAKADVIDLAPPGETPFTANNVGQARSFIFDADENFDISSVGIRMDPLIGSFDLRADLYTVAPGTLNRGALLASSSVQMFSDVGLDFYDVLFDFSFTGGQRFELELQPTAAGGFGFGQFDMEFFDFQGFPPGTPPDSPFTVGPLTVLDGAGSGNVGGPSNSVISHFRLDVDQVVPEPATLTIFGLGAIGMAGAAIRRRRKTA